MFPATKEGDLDETNNGGGQTPSPFGAAHVITCYVQRCLTMDLEESVNERVSFLKEQIDPNNREIENLTFQLQIEVLRNADRERVALLILQKKKQLENACTIRV